MGAPKGNQYAIGNTGGRPRYTSPSPEEVIKLGEDLVQWATEPTSEKRTAWSFWYCLKHGMIQTQFKALKNLEEFKPYYEIARSAMAQKIHNEELEKGMAHRYVRMYDRELAEEEDQTKRDDADIKRMSDEQVQDLLVKIISYSDAKKSN